MMERHPLLLIGALAILAVAAIWMGTAVGPTPDCGDRSGIVWLLYCPH